MTERQPNPQITAFFERLERLDAGGRARLRRSAGKPLAEAGKTLALFYSLLPPGIAPRREELYFLVATLYPLAESGGQGNLGMALCRARREHNAAGLDRRLEALLDADESQLPFRLRQAARYLQSTRVRVDWPRLLEDLLVWDHPKRFIQQEWARSYFSAQRPSD